MSKIKVIIVENQKNDMFLQSPDAQYFNTQALQAKCGPPNNFVWPCRTFEITPACFNIILSIKSQQFYLNCAKLYSRQKYALTFNFKKINIYITEI